jgi:Desulfoferrodoxin, N-terminal domain
MAVAKKAPAKKAKKAPAKKAAPAKAAKPTKAVKTVKTVKPAKKAATRKGAKYGCKACGLVVSVVEDCGCATMNLVCCNTPMKKKRPPVKK